MSLPPGSPYKSRLFNYLSSQSVRLKDGLQIGLRRLRNAATLGVQILLYPLYLLVQAGRLTGRQLEQNAKRLPVSLHNSPIVIDADQPLTAILATIEPYLVITEETETLKLHQILNPYHKPTISQFSTTIQKNEISADSPPLPDQAIELQGLATILENRHLALVGSANLVLDILSQEQQQRLEKRIRLEIANYYYQKRLQARIQGKVTDFVPALEPANQRALAPIRWFWQVLRWEQHSEVAVSINLFGEGTLVPLTPEVPFFTTAELLNYLETTPLSSLALWWSQMQVKLEQQSQTIDVTVVGDAESFQGWQLERLIQGAIAYFYGKFSRSTPLSGSEPPPHLLDRFKGQVESLLVPAASSSLEAPQNPFGLQVLMQAAIKYFFQQQPTPLEGRKNAEGDDDPWLMWEDLYPEVVPLSSESEEVDSFYSLPNPTSTYPPLASSRTKQSQPSTLTPRESPSAELDVNHQWNDRWIDTKAETIGYAKHPLETILKGIDRLILWLESWYLQIYHWIRSLWKKRNQRKK